jgi:hypothetical protein
MKISAEGDSLWEVDYIHYSFNSSERLSSLVHTRDGGFIMAGSTITEDQDSWVNKVDSNGIGVFVADTARIIPNAQERINPSASYVIHPNPAKNEITLRFPEDLEAIPEQLEWINLSGQVVSRQEINESDAPYSVPGSSGIYLILIKDESQNILHRERVVVE